MDKIVFTNGCFDIIHPGHIDLLERARSLGTRLIVGINSDKSVHAIRGGNRPFISENDRAFVLRNLKFADEVRIFEELTPETLIREIKPDILVKGGDWAENEIIGADFVKNRGGRVYSLPLREGYSSSRIVEKIQSVQRPEETTKKSFESLTKKSLNEHLEVIGRVIGQSSATIEECADLLFETFQSGNKILISGNGGSAADAQHLAAEFVGRYETERRALPAIALTTDTSALTALSNDYGFERVYARQVEALAQKGDVLIAISTSGNSPNIISSVMAARQKGCKIIGMTGENGKKLASLCDLCIVVPSDRTARIQEMHITIAHIWCEILDGKYTE